MYLEYIPKLQFQSLMTVLDKSFIFLYRVINMKWPIKRKQHKLVLHYSRLTNDSTQKPQLPVTYNY